MAARVAAFAVALATAVAAAACRKPGLVPFALLAPSPLVAGFLFYSAALIAHIALRPRLPWRFTLLHTLRSLLIGRQALFITGLVELFLAWDALKFDPVNWPVAALAVPGLVSLAFAYAPWFMQAEAEAAPTPDTGKSTDEDDRSGLVVLALYGLRYGGLLALIGAGLYTYQAFSDILLRHIPVPPAEFFRFLPPLAFQTMREVLPFAVLVVVGILLYHYIGSIGAKRVPAQRHDSDRTLAADEVAFIEKCVADLRAHGAERGREKPSYTGAFLLLFALFAAAAALALINAYGFDESPVATPSGLYLYVPGDAPSYLLVLVTMVLTAFLPTHILRCTWRGYDAAVAWRFLGPKAVSWITTLVRLGEYGPEKPFDPAPLLIAFGRTWGTYLRGLLIAVVAAGGWYLVLDRDKAAVFTVDGIDTMDAYTLGNRHIPYAQVRGITLACAIDNGLPVPHTIVELPHYGRVDLARGLLADRDVVTRYVIRLKILASNVGKFPVTFGVHRDLRGEYVSDYDPHCIDALAVRFEGSDARLIRAIFPTPRIEK